MARYFKKREESWGQAPGSLVFIGNKKIDKPRIRVIDYNSKELEEAELNNIREIEPYLRSETVSWINIDGLHDIDLISEIGNLLELHPLMLEDILNTAQRPKFEEFENSLYFAIKMLMYDNKTKKVSAEQLSIVVGKGFVLTFQERVGDVFEPVRERIRKQKGRIRNVGSDYLAYALIDTVIDNYVRIIENIGSQIEDEEEHVLFGRKKGLTDTIHTYKMEIGFLLKVIRPLRDISARLVRTESEIFHKQTHQFINDLDDLISHTLETLDTYREILSDYLNIYHAGISNKMNDIMKVLTIFSAIFIPMTFLAGIYGMNFDNLPELHFRYGYFIFWGVNLGIFASMIIFFKKKKWF